MRVLFLTTELPWPLDGGGKVRTFETLACLASFAEVQMLAVSEHSDAQQDRKALQAALPGVAIDDPIEHPVRIRRRPAAMARAALLQIVHREPYLVAKFRNGRYTARAQAMAAADRPDLVWCDHLNVFPAALAARRVAGPGTAIVLDEHNVETDLFRKGAGAGGILGVLAALESRRVARYERAALETADRIVAISAEDACRLAELGAGHRVQTCLPAVGSIAEELGPPEAGPSVVFLGSLSWPPNAEAARFLALEVLPRLRKLVPGVTVRIGGRGLDPASERRIRAAGAELAGYVDDATDFLRSASVVVVPVLSGSGISIKLLDSLKAGVPTVTTSVGARGLPVRDRIDVLVADGAQRFAEAVAALLEDHELRRRLVAGARDYLLANHSRQTLAERYRAVAQDAVALAGRIMPVGSALLP